MKLRLTFDDGPSEWTLPLLRVLEKHGHKAIFFMVGQRVRQNPGLALMVKQAGHTIGNHSMHHKPLDLGNYLDVHDEVRLCRDELTKAVGEHSNLFRPPYGRVSNTLARVVADLGMEMVLWEAVGIDWSGLRAEEIVANVDRKMDDIMVLLHDSGTTENMDRSETVKAADILLGKYR